MIEQTWDHANQMHFSHDRSATKRYYFPDNNSFVLFECLTEIGWWVVGARGLGLVHAYNFERFVYQGRFAHDDFFDGRLFRPWNDIRDRLAGKRYRALGSKDFCRALTGVLEEVPLGLVPLRQANNYASFRVLFRNLLRLSHLPAYELQTLLIDIHEHLLDQPKIDLEDSHKSYQEAMRLADTLRELKDAEPDIRDAIQTRRKRDKSRGELMFWWYRLRDKYQDETTALRERSDQFRKEVAQIAAALAAADTQLARARAESSAIEREYGALQNKFEELNESRAKFNDFSVEQNTLAIELAQHSRDALLMRIANLSDADPVRVDRKITELKGKIADDRRVLDNRRDLVITRLRQDGRLSDGQLEDISRIIHPQIFRLSVAPESGRSARVEDLSAAIHQLQLLAARFDDEAYRDGTVTIPRAALGAGVELAAEFEPRAIEARIAEMCAEHAKYEDIQRDLTQRAELERQKSDCEARLEALQQKFRDWKAWQQGEKGRAELVERRAALDQKRQEYDAAIGALIAELEALRARKTVQERSCSDVEQRSQYIQRAYSQLVEPPFDAEAIALEDDALFEQPLETLFDKYRTLYRDERRLSEKVAAILDQIDRTTGSRFAGHTEAQTVENLEKALASLGEQEDAISQMWRSLITGLRRQLKGLLGDLREITRQVGKLNRALSGRKISNLSKLELVIRPDERLVGHIEAILAQQEQPLFADARKAERASRDLARLLEDRPTLELKQLFSLQFRIEDASGESKRFEALDQIESQGTTVTIKVLIHLELLHRMLREGEAHIPFFLDEVSVLDDKNLSAIVAHAHSMNFVPVVASPDPRDCVDTLYFLRSASNGKVVLEPRTSRVRLRREARSDARGDNPRQQEESGGD